MQTDPKRFSPFRSRSTRFSILSTTSRTRILSQLGPDTLMMAGDNPALPKMPERPTMLDFFRLRFRKLAVNHMLQSAQQCAKGRP